MELSQGEKLIIWMLCDLYKHHGVKGEVDPEFVMEAITGGHLWAFDWKYGLVMSAESNDKAIVSEVVDVLDMWTFIESGYAKLSPEDKARVEKETGRKHIEFAGFDGNNESTHYSIACFLIEKMGRFGKFKGRELNSHHPSIDGYRQMLRVFDPVRKEFDGDGLTTDNIIDLLNARAA